MHVPQFFPLLGNSDSAAARVGGPQQPKGLLLPRSTHWTPFPLQSLDKRNALNATQHKANAQ